MWVKKPDRIEKQDKQSTIIFGSISLMLVINRSMKKKINKGIYIWPELHYQSF